MAEGHLERLRRCELQSVNRFFAVGARVLEIGGGNGFQARIINDWGCEVVSVDVGQGRWEARYFPVIRYNGRDLPFAGGAFDVVFSSNVLEHVADLPALLSETRRVLRRGGQAVHIVPTTHWRFWTLVTHYPHMIRQALFGRRRSASGRQVESVRVLSASRGVGALLRAALFPPPHGEFPSVLAELRAFSRKRWSAVFKSAGWEVAAIVPNDLFYTGNVLFPDLGLGSRRTLARLLGSACDAYVLHPVDEPRAADSPSRGQRGCSISR